MKMICKQYAVQSLIVLALVSSFAGCACLNENACAARNDMEPLRLACRLANYGKFQEQGLAHISGMGLNYVFMNLPKAEEVDAVAAQLKALNLELIVARGETNLSTDDAIEDLRGQFEICKTLGLKYLFLSPKRHDAPKEEVYERLRKAGDAAADNDVILVLETHPDLGTNAAIHIETMKAIDHPNVRVNFDVANILYYNEGADPVEDLKACIDYVATVEVKDHDGKLESWFFPALGEGVVDFPDFFKVLRDHGYTGPITIEVEGIKGIEWSEADTHKAMEDSVRYLQSIETFK